ncbi:DUF6513 domain-containing protein [Planctomicrobium sp. SH664]|uniref:DUF6513 domain-containing protein n=1 Tax=Planctomicrobium sp. SH664 TaxID=3448125 RepID=UPI003F5C9A3F
MTTPTQERILFVTGRLAEGLVRQVVAATSDTLGIHAEVQVVGISVSALMHVRWLRSKLTIDRAYDRVLLPGWCQGDLGELDQQFGIPFERGPKDILDLPQYFGLQRRQPVDLTTYDIQILAEINHTPQLSSREILEVARSYARDGADLIDVGCIPGLSWPQIGDTVRMLRDEGLRVSVDSFDRREVEEAVAAGAEMVLSCNQSNVHWAADLDAEFVVIPDDPALLDPMFVTAAQLAEQRRCCWLDPILEPIGFRFAESLARYFETRRKAPTAAMMMGIGNLTEMTEVDSAGLNFLLAAICQELEIHSVLTTQVINWARTSVAEFDRARRMVKYAIEQCSVPKRLSQELVILRDPNVPIVGQQFLSDLARQLKDPNYRIFVERGEIHVMNRDGYWRGTDAFELFDAFHRDGSLDIEHAFYLGYELSKAVTALTLGKHYTQDQSLRWGFLTVPEQSAHERRRRTQAVGEES